jgi:hypothetical protein
LSTIAGVTATTLFVIFKKSAQKYVDEKAKNLATIEDTEKITNEVEKVKSDYLQRSHAWKQIFELEYAVLKDVWSATCDFQAHGRSLRPLFDRLPNEKDKQKETFEERYKKYIDTAMSFQNTVIKNQPFIPVHVYEACMSLRKIVIELQVDFELSLNESSNHDPDWSKINECGKKLDKEMDELNNAIRKHIYGKMNGAEQLHSVRLASRAADA